MNFITVLTINEVTEIFYLCDEFSKEFEKSHKNSVLQTDNAKKTTNKPNRLSHSVVMTILISFHLGGYRNLKHYYLFYVSKHMKGEFPKLVSYNRFVELQQQAAFPLVLFLKLCRTGDCPGISFSKEAKDVFVYSLQGQCLLNATITNKIDVSSLSNGDYLISFINFQSVSETQKFQIAR